MVGRCCSCGLLFSLIICVLCLSLTSHSISIAQTCIWVLDLFWRGLHLPVSVFVCLSAKRNAQTARLLNIFVSQRDFVSFGVINQAHSNMIFDLSTPKTRPYEQVIQTIDYVAGFFSLFCSLHRISFYFIFIFERRTWKLHSHRSPMWQ